MSWREEVLGPLRERTLENAQVQLLAERYDLSRDSRLARAIVLQVNRELDAEERRRGVQRVRPGELLIRTGRGDLVLPLRTEEDIDRALAGERWDVIRRDIVARCEALYRQLYPEAPRWQVDGFLRCLWPGTGHRVSGPRPSPIHGPRRERPWGSTRLLGEPLAALDAQRARRWVERDPPRPAHRPETLAKLQAFLRNEAGIAPAVQEPMLLDLMSLRARFCPRVSVLATGQMPLAAMHVDSGRSLWQPTRYQPLAPVVVTWVTGEESQRLRHDPPRTYEDLMERYGRRMGRAMVEAYTQDGLLSHMELQWIFLTSIATVSRALDWYQRQHQVILPCPGTVLDMGRTLTHKDLIVRLHLQGMSVLEIARHTYHHPRSVDAYLKAFDSVLILHLYGLPPHLMARALGRGETLVYEYLDLIDRHLKDVEAMRDYLRGRGVRLPAELSQHA